MKHGESAGECLAFYLKYYPEMTKIYREEEEVPGLPEPQDTKEKALRVGKAADEEAASLLEKCAELIVAHFSEIGSPNIRTHLEKRSQIEKDWTISVAVCPRDKRIRSERMKVGVSLVGTESRKPELVPWIWRKGVEDTEHAFVSYLQAVGKAKGTWLDLDLVEGAIALARISIELPAESFEINGYELLETVKEAIKRFDQKELVQWYPS